MKNPIFIVNKLVERKKKIQEKKWDTTMSKGLMIIALK